MRNLNELREHFPALKQVINGRKIVYFDNGATTQKPLCVTSLVNMMNEGINGNIHRAVHELSARSTELYEGARERVRKFINAQYPEEIIFTSGTTAGLNLLASSFGGKFLNEGDSVLLTEAEHHSNIVPWQMVCERRGAKLKVMPVDEDGIWRFDLIERYLTPDVKIVSVAHISNVLGLVNPVEEIVSAAHKKGIPVILDGAQGIVHEKVDVRKLGCDFYLFSGHKLYGPTGTGVLYGKKALLENMPPWLGGGDMVDTVTFEKTTYAALPLKFEAGTPNFIGAAGMGEAINFTESVSEEFLRNHEKALTGQMLEGLGKIDGLRIYGTGKGKIPLFSFSVEGIHPTDLAMLLDKMGIAVRSGMMCAEPLIRRFGCHGLLRASLAMYNTSEEIDYFLKSLQRAVKMLT
ncbi:MAG: SufS family cysteine desulfurase [Bacteroidales bacterium]|nr:SufS family cysteine desulfurase [Bacteroidales bacterium]MDD2425237.1 SufS family cysteine desulfurase [Bacteroidales bacterium]MDD3988926.1 SufS family cysteine desulfurase [Bacteroidales bacterium]